MLIIFFLVKRGFIIDFLQADADGVDKALMYIVRD